MQLGLDPKKLVFLDEMGAKTNMTRLYGRSPIGQRLIDHVPHGHWSLVEYDLHLRFTAQQDCGTADICRSDERGTICAFY